MHPPAARLAALLPLPREPGTPARAPAILGEGNASTRPGGAARGDATFLVKDRRQRAPGR